MAFESEKSQYDADGFVVVRDLLGASEFGVLRENLDRYIREVVPGLTASEAFYVDAAQLETLKQLHRMNVDPFFEQYRNHPRWRSLAEALVGEEVSANEPESFNKPPGTDSPTPPHQDNYYFCLRPPNVVTIWLALDRVDEGNGCLRYVRGSHRRGIRPHQVTRVLGFSQGISDYGNEDRALETPILLEPGDVVAHHGNTIHRAEGNRSTDRNRRAFAMVWRGVSCRRDEEAFARYRASFEKQYQDVAAR
jgi:phytanoyl-CoA hydroxylase